MLPRVSQKARRGQIYRGVGSAAENIFAKARHAKLMPNYPPASVQRAALRRLKAKPRENTLNMAEAAVNSGGSIEKKLER